MSNTNIELEMVCFKCSASEIDAEIYKRPAFMDLAMCQDCFNEHLDTNNFSICHDCENIYNSREGDYCEECETSREELI